MGRQTAGQRRHDRAPTEAQRDERVRLDVDPEEALKRLLGADDETEDDDSQRSQYEATEASMDQDSDGFREFLRSRLSS